MMLCGFGHVSSEQAVLHCSETLRSAIDLSVPLADRLRLRCGNQSVRLSKRGQVLQKCALKDAADHNINITLVHFYAELLTENNTP